MSDVKVKPIVLIFSAFYFPGYLGGGPIRSLKNMVDRLSQQYSFLIITQDRDLGSTEAYAEIVSDSWNQIGNTKVFYISPLGINIFQIMKLLKRTQYDVLYLNSFFGWTFSIFPLISQLLGICPYKPTILAPRGEFSRGAISIKKKKKYLFLSIARLLGIHKSIMWQASTKLELLDILKIVGTNPKNILIAEDLVPQALPLQNTNIENECPHEFADKRLNICFLSRISPKKNLDFALQVLSSLTFDVIFTIYGPAEDQSYWKICNLIAINLPKNITVIFAGSVPHTQISSSLAKHDLLFFPTKGENFGHVIIEAFSAGLPVLISDQTPWRNLESQNIGWDLSLDSSELFAEKLEIYANLSISEKISMKNACVRFARKRDENDDALTANLQLLNTAVKVGS